VRLSCSIAPPTPVARVRSACLRPAKPRVAGQLESLDAEPRPSVQRAGAALRCVGGLREPVVRSFRSVFAVASMASSGSPSHRTRRPRFPASSRAATGRPSTRSSTNALARELGLPKNRKTSGHATRQLMAGGPLALLAGLRSLHGPWDRSAHGRGSAAATRNFQVQAEAAASRRNCLRTKRAYDERLKRVPPRFSPSS